jgi:hypothetical protein
VSEALRHLEEKASQSVSFFSVVVPCTCVRPHPTPSPRECCGKAHDRQQQNGKMSRGMANGKSMGTRGPDRSGDGGCRPAGGGVGFLRTEQVDEEPKSCQTSVWQWIIWHMRKVLTIRCSVVTDGSGQVWVASARGVWIGRRVSRLMDLGWPGSDRWAMQAGTVGLCLAERGRPLSHAEEMAPGSMHAMNAFFAACRRFQKGERETDVQRVWRDSERHRSMWAMGRRLSFGGEN